MHPSNLRSTTAALLAVAIGATACGVAAGANPPGPAGPETFPVSVDWNGPTIEPVDLGDGWTVTPCVDGASILCVTDDRGVPVGTVELGRWKADDVDAVGPWLRQQVDDFLDTFASDRSATCGDGYQLRLDGAVRDVVVDGEVGVTYIYRGIDAEGVERERGMTTLVLRDDEAFWISAVSYDPDGCIASEGGEFTPTVLGAFAPWYDRIVKGSTLPDAQQHGVGEERLEGRVTFNGDAVVVRHVRVLSGEAARRAAVEDGLIEEGEDLPNDVYVRAVSAQSQHDVADEVDVEVYDCTSGCTLVEVSIDDLRSGAVSAYGGTDAVYELTTVDGVITAMTEVYLP